MVTPTGNVKRRARSAAWWALNTPLGKRTIQYVPPVRDRVKHEAELSHWRSELELLHEWFVAGTRDWWGVPPVPAEKKLQVSDIWITNAVMTLHQHNWGYEEDLQLERDAFKGERLLDVGCGPLAPILQFADCERHAIDPLLDRYIEAGWPMYDYDVRLLNVHGENLPYPDNWFDGVISVNALDHVDDFEAVAKEMIRVLKPGGRITFEIEYHQDPTLTEPIFLNDDVIAEAFRSIDIAKVRNRTHAERFSLLADSGKGGSGGCWALWKGVKR